MSRILSSGIGWPSIFSARLWPSRSSMAMKLRPVALLDGVDGADVRMVQRRGGTRLLLEALERVGVAFSFSRQELQRNVASELAVLRLVHHAHAARAQAAHEWCTAKGCFQPQCPMAVSGFQLLCGVKGVTGNRQAISKAPSAFVDPELKRRTCSHPECDNAYHGESAFACRYTSAAAKTVLQ